MPEPTQIVTQDITVTAPGTVIDGVRVEGRIIIKAPDVTIKNTTVVGNKTPSRYGGLIDNAAGYANLRIINVHVQEQTPSPFNTSGINGSHFTADHVTVVGQVDSVQIKGDDVTIINSVLRDTVYYSSHLETNGEPTHNDNIQILKGLNLRIENNRLTGSQNYGLLAAAEWGPVTIVARGNFLDDGRCTAKVSPYNGNPASGTFTGNTFGPNREYRTCALIVGAGFQGQVSPNYWADGQLVTNIPG